MFHKMEFIMKSNIKFNYLWILSKRDDTEVEIASV